MAHHHHDSTPDHHHAHDCDQEDHDHSHETHAHHGHDHHHGHHHHGHGHHHGHSHALANFGRAFAIGIALNFGFVLVEGGAGIYAHSLALLADAGHNLSDVFGLIMAWVASVLARRAPTPRRTYGLRRTSVLAALFNALFLLVAIGGIAWEAVRRLREPAAVEGGVVIGVALLGIAINTATALMFMSGRKDDLNIRGAYLHMAADAAVSAGVVVAGLAMSATGWLWLDPLVSLVIVVVIFMGTWGLLCESLNLALDAVPPGIAPEAVREYLASLPEVIAVHDLHIWAMSTTETALTAHLVRRVDTIDGELLITATRELQARFGIQHVTLQVENQAAAAQCPQACENAKSRP